MNQPANMSAAKSRPTFWQGAVVALVLSLLGVILHALMEPVLRNATEVKVLIGFLSLAYTGWLLFRSSQRSGRLTGLLLWAVAATAIWWLAPSLELYLLAHIGTLWLYRSLLSYASVLSAVADLGLNALSLATAAWAASQTASLFATLWCFFLTQALFVWIPANWHRKQAAVSQPREDDPFERAHQTAEAALRRLSGQL